VVARSSALARKLLRMGVVANTAVFSMVLALVAVAAPARAADAPGVAEAAGVTAVGEAAPVEGLYPLWEQTAALYGAGGFAIGYGHAGVGLGLVQLGTQPILDLHGALNLQAKVALLRRSRFAIALVLGAYHFPTAAEGRTVGNLNPTGFSNPYAPVWLFPVALAKSARFGDRLSLHWTSTLLLSRSQAPEQRYLSGGQTLLVELRASPHWAARVHGGIEGWPVETQAHAGLSFGYSSTHLMAAAGVARRFSFEGESANMVLLDGGLLFP
jgi:hypothetical protein